MLSVGIFNILFDKSFLATALAALLAFATIVTLGLPLAERDGLGARLKSVAARREELRARHHAALNAKRFAAAKARYGLAAKLPPMDQGLFRAPPKAGGQIDLFG